MTSSERCSLSNRTNKESARQREALRARHIACVSGILLLRHHWLGYCSAVGQLVWLELTCVPILLTPFIANLRGDNPGWSVMAPIGVMAVATLTVLWSILHTVGAHPAETEGDRSKARAINASVAL